MKTTHTGPSKQKHVNRTQNEGEGSYQATRNYDNAVEKTVKSGNVERLGKEAERALDGPEGKALREAEASAKRGPDAPIAKRPSRDSLDRATDEGMPEAPAKNAPARKG